MKLSVQVANVTYVSFVIREVKSYGWEMKIFVLRF